MKVRKLLIIAGVALLYLVLASLVLVAANVGRVPLTRANSPEVSYDFGDAPDPTYPTLLASNGARHILDGETYLGANVDPEADGQPHPSALGDDLAGLDDEDSTLFTSPLVVGGAARLDLWASVRGLLTAWLDLNVDGDWDDNGEQIFTDEPLLPGSNGLTFQVPEGASTGTSYARLRFSTVGGLGYSGEAPNGEVEDLGFEIRLPSPSELWEKWVNDTPWQPGLALTLQTTDTVEVVDVVRADAATPFILAEHWNPQELRLLDYTLEPPLLGQVVSGNGAFLWNVPVAHPEVITLTKWFHVEPCTWTVTILEEAVRGLAVSDAVRRVILEKQSPLLGIDAQYHPEVDAGDVVTFTLSYLNAGGYENGVVVQSQFPPEALFVDSQPKPSWQAPDGSVARWEVGDLEMGAGGHIDVTAAIEAGVQPSTTVVITGSVYNHAGAVADQVLITYHVEGRSRIFLPVVLRNRSSP